MKSFNMIVTLQQNTLGRQHLCIDTAAEILSQWAMRVCTCVHVPCLDGSIVPATPIHVLTQNVISKSAYVSNRHVLTLSTTDVSQEHRLRL